MQSTLKDMAIFKGVSNQQTAIKTSDLHIAAFITEHNLSYNLMEHLPELIKKVCPDSDMAKQIKCGRTKCSSLVKNVIGKRSEQEICEILNHAKFSLIIDESTDRSCTKHLCLVCRYRHNNRIQDSFLALLPLKEAKAEDLYKEVTNFFNKKKIPYQRNLIGFASDGANVMVGKHNSVVSRLKADVPNVYVIKCICHSFHLCASYACLKLPRGIEDLARDIYTYFSNSPKRVETLKEFQHFCNVKIHKMLHPAQTRWLSVESVVSRILEQYGALILYFTDASLNDRTLASENILIKLNDQFTKIYLEFLEFSLPFFTNLNRQMQSEKPEVAQLYKCVSAVYKSFLECFIKRDILIKTALHQIDFNNPNNVLPLEELYLGAKVQLSLERLNESDRLIFRKRCLEFFVEAAKQITQRFDFDDPVLININLISVKNVLEKKSHSIVPLVRHFPNLVSENELQLVDNEWRLLRNTDIDSDENVDIEHFWTNIENMRYGDGTSMFPVLSRFVFDLLVLPHSSANVERVFSDINLMKTDERNKLSSASIVGHLHTKNFLKTRKSCCYNVVFPKEVLNLHNNDMYKKTVTEISYLTDSE
ncbi:zinc finger protein 862-like [Diabrotica undecimpunctata]|uniref:zinc finger protein 862-like n=1 Tax=Diabrotica undecimpunctata TaxID=50387 RepID=UPI003B632A77